MNISSSKACWKHFWNHSSWTHICVEHLTKKKKDVKLSSLMVLCLRAPVNLTFDFWSLKIQSVLSLKLTFFQIYSIFLKMFQRAGLTEEWTTWKDTASSAGADTQVSEKLTQPLNPSDFSQCHRLDFQSELLRPVTMSLRYFKKMQTDLTHYKLK